MTNENIFDEIEQVEAKEQNTETAQEDLAEIVEQSAEPLVTESTTPTIAPEEMNLDELIAHKAKIEEEGADLEELELVKTLISEKENKIVAPSLDDLDDTPDSEKYRMVTSETEVPEKLELTIEDVYLQAPMVKTFDGEDVKPTQGPNGNYYKAKVVLKFVEEVNGGKIKQSIPSIFYSVNEDGVVSKLPGIPKAVADEDMKDNMKSSLGKLRNKYCKFICREPNTIGNVSFLKGLIGKKVSLKKVTGTHKGRKWGKLVVVDFVKTD